MTFTILITLEVISRYLFNFSIFFINSAAGFLLVWFFLLGAGLALRQSAHVGLDFVSANLPPRVGRLAWTIAQGLLLVFLLAMFWSGCSTLRSASRQVEGALGISLVWVMLAFPVGFLLLIYHHVIMVVMTIRMPPAEDGAP
jgi:TRAP-type C4-dicarboxylate transport system permease small subunit